MRAHAFLFPTSVFRLAVYQRPRELFWNDFNSFTCAWSEYDSFRGSYIYVNKIINKKRALPNHYLRVRHCQGQERERSYTSQPVWDRSVGCLGDGVIPHLDERCSSSDSWRTNHRRSGSGKGYFFLPWVNHLYLSDGDYGKTSLTSPCDL